MKITRFLIGGAVLMFGLLAACFAAASSGADVITVEAELEPFVTTSVRNPLLFQIKGEPGTYDAVQGAEYTLEANVPVTVTFTAAPLAYEFDDSVQMDVLYWVDHETNSFAPGQSVAIHLPFTRHERHTLQLRGRINVHEVAAQPAGTYRGTIWITVSAND